MDAAKLMALMKAKKASMKRVERAAKFNPGKNRIRILQGWRAGEEHIWYHDFGQHYIKDSAGAVQAVYMCHEHTYGQPCAVCAAVKSASRAATDDETQKLIGEASAGKVILINALMLDSTEPNTPVVLEIKGKLFTQLIEMLEENGPEAFFDLDAGHEIIVTRDGKGISTTYSGQMAIKVGTPIPKAVLSKLHNLDEYVKQDNEDQERRAIAAVSTIAGHLPAPSGRDVPRTNGAPAIGMKPPADDIALDSDLDDILGELDAGTSS